MRTITRLCTGVAGLASIAAAVPAAAQYYGQSYNGYNDQYRGYNDNDQYGAYGYNNQYNRSYQTPYQGYGNGYGYGYRGRAYAVNTGLAQQQCTSAVQSRLDNRMSLGRIIGSMLGATTNPRVVSITQVSPRSNGTMRVRGFASSGRMASNGYGRYGEGAYGALGYGYASAADLAFRCDVGPNGAVYDVSINRR